MINKQENQKIMINKQENQKIMVNKQENQKIMGRKLENQNIHLNKGPLEQSTRKFPLQVNDFLAGKQKQIQHV